MIKNASSQMKTGCLAKTCEENKDEKDVKYTHFRVVQRRVRRWAFLKHLIRLET
jgi:hypothetical protein